MTTCERMLEQDAASESSAVLLSRGPHAPGDTVRETKTACGASARTPARRQVSPKRVAVKAARSDSPPKRKPPARVTARAVQPVNQNKIGVRNKAVGAEGEHLAARFLQDLGYEVVARNWSCKAGEVDIIVRDGPELVFVEVKTRTSVEKGLPSDAVDERKRRKYELIAKMFTQHYASDSINIRFDVMSVLLQDGTALIRHHIDAFGVA